MKKLFVMAAALMVWGTLTASAVDLDSAGRDPKYVETIMQRSQKVTDALKITGTEKGTQVLNIVANRYFKLNDIYSERPEALQESFRIHRRPLGISHRCRDRDREGRADIQCSERDIHGAVRHDTHAERRREGADSRLAQGGPRVCHRCRELQEEA